MEELRTFIREENREGIIRILAQSAMEYNEFPPYDASRFDSILQNILNADKTGRIIEMPVRHKKVWIKWVAAACIVLVAALAVVLSLTKSDIGTKPPVAATSTDIPAPQNNRAVITLADGRKVYLDSAGNGLLAQQDNVKVLRNERGEIVYDARAASLSQDEGSTAYNTLFNPRGSKVISLTLSDGTKVWLNSESLLRYPAAFTGNMREVEITGEAYFEVAKNAKQPFHVKKGETDITVLGTSFNINAYEDEDALRVTLVDGSVKVSNKENSAILKPGEQAVATTRYSPLATRPADLEQVTAWKDGRFQFEGEGIETVMKQISRWYDVEVVYESKPKDHFRGGISRDVDASKVFQMLETMGVVKFEIKGKQVTVKAP
jgi:transmembrane sensor